MEREYLVSVAVIYNNNSFSFDNVNIKDISISPDGVVIPSDEIGSLWVSFDDLKSLHICKTGHIEK